MSDIDTGAAEAAPEDTSLAPQVEAETTQETPGDDPAATEQPAEGAEGEQPPAKPKQTAQERIAEVTALRREAEREAEFWKAKALQASTPEPKAEAEPQGNARPDPNQYEYGDTDPQFIEDLTDWKVSKALEQRFGEQDQRQAIVKTIETFKGRVAQSFPDGEPEGMKAYRALQTVPVALQDIVLSSENGPKLAAHYGSNRAELERLSGLSPTMQAYEIAKTEARLSGPPSAPVKTVSTAPEPPGHMSRGAGGKFTVAADTDDFAAFEKAYGNG